MARPAISNGDKKRAWFGGRPMVRSPKWWWASSLVRVSGGKPHQVLTSAGGGRSSDPGGCSIGGIPVAEQTRPKVEERRPARAPTEEAPELPGRGPIDWRGGWRWAIPALLILTAVAVAL